MGIKDNLYAVILAGGSGTRFWPLSRKALPKQFLNIIGKRTLLQDTLWRIQSTIKKKNILIVTNAAYYAKVRGQTASFGISKSNILLEPEGKNTAPAIGWAASCIRKINRNGVMVVLPSDHLILDRNSFLQNLKQAVRLATADYLVTVGIVPTRPETGYGYLKIRKKKIKGKSIFFVEKFVEKPSLQKAKRFLKEKKYLWNGGIFVWKASIILDEFKKHLPSIYTAFESRNSSTHVKKIWQKLPTISIDYGILEKADNIITVPPKEMSWSDLGSWEALADVLPKDKHGNIFKGDTIDIGSKKTFVLGKERLIVTVGLDGIIVVDTPSALLICRKDLSQKIREVVSFLKKKKRKEHFS